CRRPELAGGRDLRAQHNLGYWLGHDYLGLGMGAVSTIENRRGRDAPPLRADIGAGSRGRAPPRGPPEPPAAARAAERGRVGARPDEPLPLAGIEHALDPAGLQRVEQLGLVHRHGGELALTDRGRFLGDAVTAALLA